MSALYAPLMGSLSSSRCAPKPVPRLLRVMAHTNSRCTEVGALGVAVAHAEAGWLRKASRGASAAAGRTAAADACVDSTALQRGKRPSRLLRAEAGIGRELLEASRNFLGAVGVLDGSA